MRNGDVICKIRAPFPSCEARGEDVIWNFELPSNDSPEYIMEIISQKDTVAIFEKGRMQHFLVNNDTLFYFGEQARRSHIIMDQRHPLLKYPFLYGDSISGKYNGSGQNESIHFSLIGSGYSVVDGKGYVTDGNDTIRNVIRIHVKDNYKMNYEDGLEETHVEERYLWYCAGSRYPIMEKIQMASSNYGREEVVDSVCYLNLPTMQLNLPIDEENEKILSEIRQQEQNGKKQAIEGVSAKCSDNGRVIEISYQQNLVTDIVFSACDLYGNILAYKQVINQDAGEWHDAIYLTHQPTSNTIAIVIRCGEQIFSLKLSV